MGTPILFDKSPNELEREIQAYVSKDQRSLPPRAKIFSAIAKIQGFDALPEVAKPDELTALIAKEEAKEIYRGMSPTRGIPSIFYARELILGAMYPGTLSVLGNGMYFATASQQIGTPEFPMLSQIAMKYAKGTQEGAGILVRAALKKDAKVSSCDDLKQELRENRNRAKKAGITDVGAFAAALGLDAFYADEVYDDIDGELVYVVLNRGKLVIQNACLMQG